MWRRGMGTAQARPASVDPDVRTPFSEPQPAELDEWPGCKKHTWKCNVKAVRFHLINISVNPSARALFLMCLKDEGALRVLGNMMCMWFWDIDLCQRTISRWYHMSPFDSQPKTTTFLSIDILHRCHNGPHLCWEQQKGWHCCSLSPFLSRKRSRHFVDVKQRNWK